MKISWRLIVAKMFLSSKRARQFYCDNYGHPSSETQTSSSGTWCGVCWTELHTENTVWCEGCKAYWDYNLCDNGDKTCPRGHRLFQTSSNAPTEARRSRSLQPDVGAGLEDR